MKGANKLHTIIIKVKAGTVIDVSNIPENTQVEIRDYDLQETTDETFNDETGDYEANCYFGKETE